MEKRSQDDYITAALAHGTAVIPIWGLIATIIIWATQKDKSRFVAFHALQATIYQAMPFIGFLFIFGCYFCSFAFSFLPFIGILPFIGDMPDANEGVIAFLITILTIIPITLPMLVIGLAIFVYLAYIGYALYSALRVFQRHDVRYPLIGRWVERHLEQESV